MQEQSESPRRKRDPEASRAVLRYTAQSAEGRRHSETSPLVDQDSGRLAASEASGADPTVHARHRQPEAATEDAEGSPWVDAKRWIKHGLGRALSRFGVHRTALRDRAVIALFHRVDDRLEGDHLSCSRAEFEDWCGFLKRHFTVVSLTELLDRVRRGQDISGLAAITFDDGYLDNHRNAAPILRRFGLPASFFVATEFIESDTVPWWDEELTHRLEWMTWDDVRDLSAQGFDVGAHTMNHVDLGVVGPEEAEREIRGSLERLEHELGRPVPHFSYPYGRREQITPENRERVKHTGFVSCLSAYGGLVRPGDDPYTIERTPVSPWYLSPYQFLFEIVVQARQG